MKRILMPVFLVAALVLALSAPARATSITLLGSHNSHPTTDDDIDTNQDKPWQFTVFHKFGHHNSNFVDTYKFLVADVRTFSLRITTANSVSSMNLQIFGDHNNLLWSLVGDPKFQTSFGNTKVDVETFTGSLLAAMVASKFMVLRVTGDFCGCASYTITAFPLPPAALMFLTSIALMGGLAWRRYRGGSDAAGFSAAA